MRNSLQPARIVAQLERDQFDAGPGLASHDAFSLVRATSHPDLFEWILVEASGKKSEAVCAFVALACTRTILIRNSGISAESLLLEMADDPERGWTILESPAAAHAWESKLATVAPLGLERLTRQHGEDLLRRTESLRHAVQHYVAYLDLTRSLSDQIKELRREADLQPLGVARRLAWGFADRLAPDVANRLAWVDLEDIYALAWLCIARHEATVEPQATPFATQNPHTNPELLWRIHLIADWVMRNYREV